MTDEFETDALHYLLDEMDLAARVAFEEQLARDPAARRALKAYADGLAKFARDTAPAEPMSAFDQRAALAAILAATKSSGGGASLSHGPKIIPWSRYVWPIAAAFLLGLNLLDFDRPLDTSLSESERVTQTSTPTPPAVTPTATKDSSDALETASIDPEIFALDEEETMANRVAGNVTPERVPSTTPSTGATRAVPMREYEQLRRNYAELKEANAAMRAEFDGIIRHLADRAIAERGLGRLAAMELVDADSFARGDRRGLREVARSILTEPGVVIAAPSVGGPADPGQPTGPATGPDGGLGALIETPPSRDAETTGPVPSIEPAYAWSVFDEKEHRGYLNVYNLPQVSADQSLQLWVKPLDSVTYQRVGEVPREQFQNGTGSLVYTLPEASLAPAEILITQEPRNVQTLEPTGPVVLRGP